MASTDRLIKEWLFRFGIEHKEDVAPRLPVWQEAFTGIDAQTLERLFKRAFTTCKFFPKISEILEPLNSVAESNFEDEWQALLDYCREWVHPDIRFSAAPELPVEIDHAARAAGGLDYLRECPHKELAWRKKAFIEDLIRSRKTGDLAGRLTGGELKKLLRQASQPAKQLPPPKPQQRQQAIDETAPLKRAVLRPPPTRKALTPEELERQKQFILQNYPPTGKEAAL